MPTFRANGFANTRNLAGVFISMALLLLSGCSSTPQTEKLLADTQATPLQSSVELTDVPFISQEKYQCGPASLAMTMQYSGLDVTEQQLRPDVYLPAKEGAFQIELKAATRKRGWVPFEIPKNMTALYQEVKAGHPVLVMQNLGLEEYPVWHYAVVIGFDFANHDIILRSGTTRRWVTSIRTFERTWQRTHYWGITVMPPTKLPTTATPETWLKAAFDLQSVGQNAAAYTAYKTGLAQWPADTALQMVAANLAYQQADYAAAAGHYEAILKASPTRTDAWNNYAYALAAMACKMQAIQAIQCARTLAPKDDNIQQSQSEIETRLQTSASPSTAKSVCNRPVRCPLKTK